MNTQFLNYFQTPAMMDALVNSSVSAEDANLRSREYAKMFSRNEEMKDLFGINDGSNLLQKTFSGYAETPLLSTQYFNASVASYVSSFAGFMSIERDFEQPNGLFYWFDVLGVTDYRSVVPNLGPDFVDKDGNVNVPESMGQFKRIELPGAEGKIEGVYAHKLIPGTVRVKCELEDGSRFELVDDGQGSLLAVPGKISAGEIKYLNGVVSVTFVDPSPKNVVILAKEDITGVPSNHEKAWDKTNKSVYEKRFIAKMQQLGLQTVPDMLVAEYNIAALGAMKKATGADMATFLFTKLREIYTKMINYKLVTTLADGYVGATMDDLDLSTATMAGEFHDYRSRVDLFDAYLINVETALAQKAVKGVDVTAYVAGANACNQFQKGGVIGKFERNTKMTYINDLLGWYDGIPVLRSTDILEKSASRNAETNEVEPGTGVFYAIHKTKDGQMAPLARGIYMPLTDTPTIGNYNNPTQMASGIYYQEGTRYMAQELVQRVEFKMGI